MTSTELRILELEQQVEYHSNLYYNEQPEISDAEFDLLWKELEVLAPKSRVLQKVGAVSSPDNWPVAQHNMFMGSLHKAMDLDGMRKWHNQKKGTQYQVGEKMDGFSLELIYDKSVLTQAVTRGNGIEGSDVTPNMKFVSGGEFLKLKEPFSGSLRAEGMILNSDFKKFFQQFTKPDGSPRYTNARNTASGLIRAKSDEDRQSMKYLTLFFYDLDGDVEFEMEEDKTDYLRVDLGLKVPRVWEHCDLKQIEKIYQKYVDSDRDNLDYEIDGLVIKIDDLEEMQAHGISNKRPNGQVALKFPAPAEVTTIRKVVWELGPSGRFCPVAMLVPKWNGRVTLRKANCHNLDYLFYTGGSKRTGKREFPISDGAVAQVYQAGDIIPQIRKVTVAGTGEYNLPTHCPVCSTSVATKDAYHVCPNLGCSAKGLGRIKFFVESVGIKFAGDKLLEEAYEKGIIKDAADLYTLTAADFKKIDRKGEKHFKKFKHYLDKTKEMELGILLGSIGVDQAKTHTMTRIVEAGYDTLDKIYSASVSDISKIRLIKGKATPICKGLHFFRPLVEKLLKNGVVIKDRPSGNLEGKAFLFTGAVEEINPATGKRFKRPELEEMVKENGGKVAAGVGKGLTYLVQSDPSSVSKKSEKATAIGVPCISVEDFLGMV